MSLPVAVGVPSSAVITPESVGAPATSAPGPIPRSAAPGPVIVAPTMVIHAAGAVAAPGIYRLPDPARVDDVVTAAGGLATDADQDALNLAARVADGERIFVPHKGQVPPSVVVGGSPSVALVGVANAPTGPGAAGAATAVVVDLNTASAEQLDSLPGVGPAIASRILERRATLGRFRSVSQLLDVPGIGDAKLAMLKNKVKV